MDAIGDDIWHVPGPDFRLPLGVRVPTRSAVIRLPDGSHLVYSPVAFPEDALAELAALGEVGHVVAPSLLHHLFAADALARWPGAVFHAPAALAAKRPDLPRSRPLGEPESSWRDVIELIAIEGVPKIDETVLFHRPSGTLVCADLLFHIPVPANLRSRIAFAATGIGGGKLAQSREWRWAAKDRARLRASMERVMALPIRQVAPAHGEPIAVDADALAAAIRA